MKYGQIILMLAAAFAPALSSQAAEGVQWVLVSENIRSDSFYLDRESIVRSGDMVRYRRKVQFGPDTPFRETNTLQEIDCKDKKMRSIDMTVIYTDGRTETLFSDAWMEIEPYTVFAVFYDLVCPAK